jgi:hypothetical protein
MFLNIAKFWLTLLMEDCHLSKKLGSKGVVAGFFE